MKAKGKQFPDAVNIVRRLANAIRRDFAATGCDVVVRSEPVRGTRLRRVTVVSPLFAKLPWGEREAYVWQIAERTLPTNELPFIVAIYVDAPGGIPLPP